MHSTSSHIWLSSSIFTNYQFCTMCPTRIAKFNRWHVNFIYYEQIDFQLFRNSHSLNFINLYWEFKKLFSGWLNRWRPSKHNSLNLLLTNDEWRRWRRRRLMTQSDAAWRCARQPTEFDNNEIMIHGLIVRFAKSLSFSHLLLRGAVWYLHCERCKVSENVKENAKRRWMELQKKFQSRQTQRNINHSFHRVHSD